MNQFRLGILASTNCTDLDGIVRAIADGGLPNVEITAVVTNKPDAGVVARARLFALPLTIVNHKDHADREGFDRVVASVLDKAEVDLVLMIGYMRIVTPWFVAHYAGHMVNVHPSLLPAFAGGMDTNVHQAVLDAGVKETGATIHLVTEEPDAGPILWQKAVPIEEGETVETLKVKVQTVEQEGLIDVIGLYQLKMTLPDSSLVRDSDGGVWEANQKSNSKNQNGRADIPARLLGFAAHVIKTFSGQTGFAVRHMVGQLIRSSSSAGANYEEAIGAQSRADFMHKLQIVLKELRESVYWLRLIQKTNLMGDSLRLEALLQEGEELCAIIGKSVVTAKKRQF